MDVPTRLSDLDYHLPEHLIAQTPLPQRDASRLLHYHAASGAIAHRSFRDLPALLRAGDLLILNDSRVLRARFTLIKDTGARVDGIFVEELEAGVWRVMLRNAGPRMARFAFERDPATTLELIERGEEGLFVVRLESAEPAPSVLDRVGRAPLPPYIKRERGRDTLDDSDLDRYQTTYATQRDEDRSGSVAAPTAGLHFTPELFDALRVAGIETARVTLHVGLGTFKPIEAENLDEHRMHHESWTIDAEAARSINRAKRERRRIICVGTTSTRVLESQPPGEIAPGAGSTDLFIRPPWTWRHVDALITNFHQPRSTLIALVAALVGLGEQRRIYAEAIAQSYRFLSFGDSMLLDRDRAPQS